MQAKSLFAHLGRSTIGAALVFAMSSVSATPTSLEFTGLLLDGSGNKITAQPYMIFSSAIYDGPTTNTLLLQLGTEHVQVQNGSFLQVFSGIDDSLLFNSTPYLRVNINGFDMSAPLGIFYNLSYFVVNGETSGGPAGSPIFQVLAGTSAAAVPEPATPVLLLGGLGLAALWANRARRPSGTLNG